jgi:hypothetical protein
MTHERYIDHLVKLAEKNPCEGIVEEPRAYFDVIRLPDQTRLPVRSNPQVFENGERYPVLLTHLLAFVRPNYTTNEGFDEALIQRVGMRLVFDNSFYQNADFQALPLWHNVVATGNPTLQRSHACFTFDRPLILTSRNSLDVRVNLSDTPTSARRCEVAFRGTGLLSKQPIVLAGSVDLENQLVVTIPLDAYRNLRAEPIALTDMTVLLTSESSDADAVGDLRPLNIAVRTVGGGTQAEFFIGPSDPAWPRMPAYMLGKTTGRCIVHRFPGDGVRLEPGQSFYAELSPLDSTAYDIDVALSTHGSIFVT